jgi:hypothetical protein
VKELKKSVTIDGQQVELFSLDGQTWSSDVRQLHDLQKARQKSHQKAL